MTSEKKSSFRDLLAQADALRAQAESIRAQEAAAAIEQIRALVDEFGISPAELAAGLGLKLATATSSSGSSKTAEAAVPAPSGRRRRQEYRAQTEARYRGPNGELWSGGAGRRPTWVKEAQARGEDMSRYLIDPTPTTIAQEQQLNLTS